MENQQNWRSAIAPKWGLWYTEKVACRILRRPPSLGESMAKVLLILIAAVICICLLSAAVDSRRFVTLLYEVRSAKIKKPCRLILLSDLHSKSFGPENGRLFRKIEALAPDGILAAGDMLTSARGEDYGIALSLLARLAKLCPVYYGMGNHEQRLARQPERFPGVYDGYLRGLREAGIEPLVNENVSLPAWNLAVCGVEIDKRFYRHLQKEPMEARYLSALLGEPDRDSFQVLIAHNPDYFEAYAAWGADLTVSGHVHGGIMRLPILGGVLSPSLTLFPKYDGGRFTKGDKTLILSRGLGSHTIPLRIFNPGELVVLELMPEHSNVTRPFM